MTLGGISDPAAIQRNYDDIERILRGNNVRFKVHEEVRPNGKFKSYTVSTS